MLTFVRINLLLALTLICLSVAPAMARQTLKPPISVKGFSYKFFPNSRMHMNFCKAKRCVQGSKVSYILNRPRPVPSFSSFKADRKLIEAAYRQRGSKGVTLKFGKPAQKKFKGFTVYSAPLQTRLANGISRYRISHTVYGKNIWISLITSSSNPKAANDNGTIFLVGLMAWSRSLKK